jgi:hypothetical protein
MRRVVAGLDTIFLLPPIWWVFRYLLCVQQCCTKEVWMLFCTGEDLVGFQLLLFRYKNVPISFLIVSKIHRIQY